MALYEVRVPPFWKGNWQGDDKQAGFLRDVSCFIWLLYTLNGWLKISSQTVTVIYITMNPPTLVCLVADSVPTSVCPVCDQGFRNDLRRVKELPKSFPAKQQVRQPLAAAWKRPGHERTAGGWCVRPQGGPQVNHCQHNHNNGGNYSGHITQTHTLTQNTCIPGMSSNPLEQCIFWNVR